MSTSFTNTVYAIEDACVSCSGVQLLECEHLHEFLSVDVASRLDDTPGQTDLRVHLEGLPLTGMGQEALRKVLDADVSEERPWAAGEALAEAYLIKAHGVIFPWNMERDKRNPFASLPGADIIGFCKNEDGNVRFALGEVKTSQEKNTPPQVMTGRSGMAHQLDSLATDLQIISQLIKWLLPRVKSTSYENLFNESAAAYFNSGNKDLILFGVLIRDTSPSESDLSGRGVELRKKLCAPTGCALLAIYLPWNLGLLMCNIRERGAS